MKRIATISLIVAALCVTATAQIRRPVTENDENGIYSRTVNHPDGSRTVSKQDVNQKIREKQTLDRNGTLLMKSIFQLSGDGKPVNGLVYDGRGRLLYRSEFTYDRMQKLQEERVFDAGGTLVRRLFYKSDRMGRRKPVSQTIFENGGQRTSSGGDLESYSTNSSHAYNGGNSASGVARTPSAYQPSSRPAAASTRTQKRERRFRIFKRKR